MGNFVEKEKWCLENEESRNVQKGKLCIFATQKHIPLSPTDPSRTSLNTICTWNFVGEKACLEREA
jgi:hypothetical protein